MQRWMFPAVVWAGICAGGCHWETSHQKVASDDPQQVGPKGTDTQSAGIANHAGQPGDPTGRNDQAGHPKYQKVLDPAVAGLFYPAHPDDLAKKVDQLLADPKAPNAVQIPATQKLRGLICPHAGYEYSGPVAAVAYGQVRGRQIRTVVVMAPSHTAQFQGASIPEVEAYRTPLGLVPLSPKAVQMRRQPPFSTKTKAKVIRPAFWRQAPKELPPFGQEDEHTFEHSLEVQLPFLQRVLKEFQLVPIVFGQVDPKQVAETLDKYLDEQTLVVASSDLSHYHPYETAVDLDRTCLEAIRRMDLDWASDQEACGIGPILTLMHLAKKRGWVPKVLDYRNSGDITGERDRGVVGYAAVAFVEGEAASAGQPASQSQPTPHSPEERKFLLDLARKSLVESVSSRGLPEVAEQDVPERLRTPAGCFVTLHKQGQLRGCIGHIFPKSPLYKAVMENAMRAALSDFRFPSVRPDELPLIDIEISILTIPRKLQADTPQEILRKLRPGVDGVVLRQGQKMATYLPQVWKDLPDKEDFLRHLAQKAGLPPDAWQDPTTEILTYQAEVFGEK
ncbi:MAG: AmmeMemoRadiSam system protein B [Thermoguttaceae bacterium]|nr:AmmeMemoRadiSam system protein B [Thermoguttaceae bacterium]MDW8037898.1 AmmeMemoRadiSam system protein B [Thermoguttaceae bacterium]